MNFANNKINFFILLLFFFLFCNSTLYSEIQELDIFNEWYTNDSSLKNDRPFFLIKDVSSFHNFWYKSNFGGYPPHIDFSKYMIFAWSPDPTRKDCSQVKIEKLLYKDGALLVLMDFTGYDKVTIGNYKKPIKAAIFPSISDSDLFIFKKIHKGWNKIEWKSIYSLWDMSKVRNRPFTCVYPDDTEKPLYAMASSSVQMKITSAKPMKSTTDSTSQKSIISNNEDEIYTPKMSQVSMPRELPESKSLNINSTSTNVQQKIVSKPSAETRTPSIPKQTSAPAKTSSAPITFGGNQSSKPVESSTKQEIAPGMGEDPLFGAEFDITF